MIHFDFCFNSLFEISLKAGAFSIVKYLIEKGADFSLRNDYGESPLDIAAVVSFLFFIFVCLLRYNDFAFIMAF